MDRFFSALANRLATFVGQPTAFGSALALILAWAASGPIFGFSDAWQLIVDTPTTIVTFLIVFLIQNAQNRDAAAMQAKLDELIRAMGAARNRFIGIEHLTRRGGVPSETRSSGSAGTTTSRPRATPPWTG